MDFYFRDLKEEKQREFISKNLAEILCEQRKKDKISMEEFLKRYSIIIFTQRRQVLYHYHN